MTWKGQLAPGLGRQRASGDRGSIAMETVLFLPLMLLLLVGMIEFGRLTYTWFTLHKTLYTLARYLGTQQGVNFCDEADAVMTAAKNYALTGTTDGSAEPFLPNLAADQIAVRIERFSAESETLGVCECSVTGCDAAAGGGAPDFLVVSIPEGYAVRLRIPFLRLDPVLLRPQVRVPFGGT